MKQLLTIKYFGATLYQLLLFGVPFIIVLKLYFRGGHYDTSESNLEGKYAVVTGGNSGIGAETVKVLCSLGCQVVIGARNRETAEEVVKTVLKKDPTAKVEFIQLDLASRKSIEAFASAISFPHIDYLINNAGLMALPQRRTTKEGFEMQWGVNHLGHFYLTYLLWKKLTTAPFFRITNVSSLAHKYLLGFGQETKPNWQDINFQASYDSKLAYARSKLYNVLFSEGLAQKVGKRGLVTSLHPGLVRTDWMDQLKGSGLKRMLLNIILFIIFPLGWIFTKSPDQGCQTTLYTVLSPEAENGAYYADCKKSKKNSHVNQENWKTLWKISEGKLGIKFDP